MAILIEADTASAVDTRPLTGKLPLGLRLYGDKRATGIVGIAI